MAKSYLNSLLGENEKILLVERQHWVILLGSILSEIVLIILLIILGSTAAVFFQPFAGWIAIAAIILLLIPIIAIARQIVIWLSREYIISNLRVIQISGIFNKSVTDSSLEKVNDVKMEQSALGRLLGYGDIEILTASELGVNLIKRIKDPIRFKTTMLNAKERLEHQPFPSPAAIPGDEEVYRPSDIPAMIAQLDQLRQKGILTEEEFQSKKAQLLSKM